MAARLVLSVSNEFIQNNLSVGNISYLNSLSVSNQFILNNLSVGGIFYLNKSLSMTGSIITNGNLLDEKLWKQMKATPYIKVIEISIDASTKDTYENKTRLNGNWDRLINNLTFLATQGHIIEEFVCSMVVSKHNYKEMYMFYELITNLNHSACAS
jgi:hypothetical protein